MVTFTITRVFGQSFQHNAISLSVYSTLHSVLIITQNIPDPNTHMSHGKQPAANSKQQEKKILADMNRNRNELYPVSCFTHLVEVHSKYSQVRIYDCRYFTIMEDWLGKFVIYPRLSFRATLMSFICESGYLQVKSSFLSCEILFYIFDNTVMDPKPWSGVSRWSFTSMLLVLWYCGILKSIIRCI